MFNIMAIFKKNKNSFLLLDYIQTMYFVSIEEILFYFTSKYQDKYNIDIYKFNSIDEFNRVITKGKYNDLLELKKILELYGVNTSIGNLNDETFRSKRINYIQFKFKDKDPFAYEKELINNYNNGLLSKNYYEPIILEIDENYKKYPGQTLVYIIYEQFLKWDLIKKRLINIHEIMIKKKILKEEFNIANINKYERLFFNSFDKQKIYYVTDLLTQNGINFVILNNEDDFVPFRQNYIAHYYGKNNISFLQSKWRYEYLNGWYVNENWDPIIPINDVDDFKM